MKKTLIVITAILCLTTLEIVALYQGINGTMFSLIVAAIAALTGVVMPTPKFLKGGE